MNKQIQEALKLAIEALNDSLTRFSTFNEMQHDAIQACQEALEQPAQEPVALVYQNNSGYPSLRWNDKNTFNYDSIARKQPDIPLYTHPHQADLDRQYHVGFDDGYEARFMSESKSWQTLTDKEIMKVYDNSLIVHSDTHYEFNNFKFARAIEQASKEKNT